MKAIVIRDSLGKLVCFGPANGNYDPGVPVGHIRSIENDYEVIVAEYKTIQDSLPTPLTEDEKFKDELLRALSDATVKQGVKDAVQDVVK